MINISNIEMNMVRDRALKAPSVTEEMFEGCNKHNTDIIKAYLTSNNHLSPKTLQQYKSGLYQFVYYTHQNLNDKPFYKIKKLDWKRYMSYLINRGLSSNSLKFKQSAVSAFSKKFLEIFYVEDDENYKSFRNFTANVVEIPSNYVYSKIPITKEEYTLMMDTLKDDENYLAMCWVAVMFNTGIRRTALTLLKSEVVNYEFGLDKDGKGKNYVMSNLVREKGRGSDGSITNYMINKEAMRYIKLWLDKRGYDSEYIFTLGKSSESCRIMSDGWISDLCQDILSDILGRRVNPHLFKASCITYLLEEGNDMKIVSKHVAHHKDISTTQKHYDLRDDSEAKDSIKF
jgi:integrase